MRFIRALFKQEFIQCSWPDNIGSNGAKNWFSSTQNKFLSQSVTICWKFFILAY